MLIYHAQAAFLSSQFIRPNFNLACSGHGWTGTLICSVSWRMLFVSFVHAFLSPHRFWITYPIESGCTKSSKGCLKCGGWHQQQRMRLVRGASCISIADCLPRRLGSEYTNASRSWDRSTLVMFHARLNMLMFLLLLFRDSSVIWLIVLSANSQLINYEIPVLRKHGLNK